MILWTELVELLQAGIFSFAQVLGGNAGVGIVAMSLLLRLMLLPLTLRLARRSVAHRAAFGKLKPDLDRLRKRYRQKPERLAEATQKLFDQRGYSPVDGKTLVGSLAQAPLFLGLFAAVRRTASEGGRFYWIADIARPDFLLTGIVAGLTCAAAALQPQLPQQGRWLILAIPLCLTLVFASRLAAGISLSWGASSLVGVLQAIWLRRKNGALATAA